MPQPAGSQGGSLASPFQAEQARGSASRSARAVASPLALAGLPDSGAPSAESSPSRSSMFVDAQLSNVLDSAFASLTALGVTGSSSVHGNSGAVEHLMAAGSRSTAGQPAGSAQRGSGSGEADVAQSGLQDMPDGEQSA